MRLNAHIYVHHVPAWYLQRSEESAKTSGTRVSDDCELPFRCWEMNPGTLEDLLKPPEFLQFSGALVNPFPHQFPSLQPLSSFLTGVTVDVCGLPHSCLFHCYRSLYADPSSGRAVPPSAFSWSPPVLSCYHHPSSRLKQPYGIPAASRHL